MRRAAGFGVRRYSRREIAGRALAVVRWGWPRPLAVGAIRVDFREVDPDGTAVLGLGRFPAGPPTVGARVRVADRCGRRAWATVRGVDRAGAVVWLRVAGPTRPRTGEEGPHDTATN